MEPEGKGHSGSFPEAADICILCAASPGCETQGTVSVAGTLPQLNIKATVVNSPDTLLDKETRKGPEDGSDKFETNVQLITPLKFEVGTAMRLVVSSAR